MKHYYLLAVIASSLLLMVSCSKNNPEPRTSLDYVIEDYETLVAKYPNAKDHFVEARFELENSISESLDVKIKSCTVICYQYITEGGGYSDIFICERDYQSGKTQISNEQPEAPWMEDKRISGAELKGFTVSVEDAVARARKEAAGSDGINTAFVTLRNPVFPSFDNAQYVFGGLPTRKDHVFVDAKTGKIQVKGAI